MHADRSWIRKGYTQPTICHGSASVCPFFVCGGRVSESDHGCTCMVMMKGWGFTTVVYKGDDIRDINNMYYIAVSGGLGKIGETSSYALRSTTRM